MNRRSFLKALAGGAVALSTGGIALLEAEPIKTYFLPPRSGWNDGGGSWELACAQEALRILNERLDHTPYPANVREVAARRGIEVFNMDSHSTLQTFAMLQRRARLVERVDKLARGWTGYSCRYVETLRGTVKVHGGHI